MDCRQIGLEDAEIQAQVRLDRVWLRQSGTAAARLGAALPDTRPLQGEADSERSTQPMCGGKSSSEYLKYVTRRSENQCALHASTLKVVKKEPARVCTRAGPV